MTNEDGALCNIKSREAFEQGRKEGALEELGKELDYFKDKMWNANDELLQIGKVNPMPHLTVQFQVWSNYNSEVNRIEKRIKELEGAKQNE